MREPPERPPRRNRDLQPTETVTHARERKAADERFEAVRRWIGDDEDGACRGID